MMQMSSTHLLGFFSLAVFFRLGLVRIILHISPGFDHIHILILPSTPVVDHLVSLTGLPAPGTYNTLAWQCQTLAVRLSVMAVGEGPSQQYCLHFVYTQVWYEYFQVCMRDHPSNIAYTGCIHRYGININKYV